MLHDLHTLARALLIVASMSGWVGGCAREAAQAEASDVAEEPDPFAPCRTALTGRWEGYGLRADYNGESGAAILDYKGSLEVVGTAMTHCALPEATLYGRGYSVEIVLVSEHLARFRVPAFGEVTLHRVEAPD